MSQSVGFDWGFVPKSGEKTSGGSAVIASAANTDSNYKVSKLRLKRRFTNEDSNGSSGAVANGRRVTKRKPTRCSLILGQPLPLPRAIELMDRDMLQATLLQLVTIHPEVQDTLAKVCPRSHDMERYTAMLERKMQAVYDHMPYSKYEAALNDYAFVRMKPAILEFLNCLIDCLLDSIPPRMTNLIQSFRFVAYGTRLLLQIPQFETQSNNYYKNICYEQVAEIWNTLIKHASADINFLSSRPTLLHYFAELRQLDEHTKGRFAGPVQLFGSVLDGHFTPQGVAVSVVEPPAVAEELGGSNSIEPVGLCNNVA